MFFLADERICIGLAKEILAQYRIDEEAKNISCPDGSMESRSDSGRKDRRIVSQ